MKKVISQLRDFVIAQKTLHWVLILLFCAISVYINYGLELQDAIDGMSPVSEFFSFVALYGVHTVFAYLLYSFLYKEYSFWKKPGFLILLLCSFFIFAIRATVYHHHYWIRELSSDENGILNGKVFNDIFRLLYLALPVTVVWFFADRDQPLYGCSVEKHKWKMYWTLLLCMVPLIVGASFLSDFLDYYPRFFKLEKHAAPVWKILVFELFYGMDFSSIELFFRGFMVMAFARYVGINAILPMSAFYLSIHYGKPMGEAISSFFGGTILGVISFHSRSILGGIMVHVGIAWLMELGGWIGNIFRGHYNQ